MAGICPTCGLPSDICVCEELGKEQQRIRVRLETRKWGKAVTIVDGITEKEADLSRLAQKLKSFCACGNHSARRPPRQGQNIPYPSGLSRRKR